MLVKSKRQSHAATIESAWQLRETNPVKSREMITALSDCYTLDSPELARILIVEANYLWREYQFEKMMNNLIQAFEILSGSKDFLWVARMHGRISIGLMALGDVTNAYKHLHLQLQAAVQCAPGPRQNAEIFSVYHNMGRRFFVKGDYKRANRCYRRCYSHVETIDVDFVLLVQNHADTHARLGHFRVASMEIKRALEIGPRVSAHRAMVYALGVKAWIYNAQDKPEQAILTHEKAKSLALQHSLPTVPQRMRLASLHLNQNQLDRAENELRPVQRLLKVEGDKHDHAQFLHLNSELSTAKGDFESALIHFKKYHRVKEEIFSSEKDSHAQSENLILRLGQLRRESAQLKQINLALQDSVSQLTSLHNEARHLSERDSLTTLYNRRILKSMAARIIKLAKRTGSEVSLAVIDLDHFKHINDRYGHVCGDRVLQKFASILSGCFRSADCVARYGGEEFVVLMANTKLEIAEKAMNRLRESVNSFNWSEIDSELSVSFSAGIAVGGGDTSFDALFHKADKYLYIAKSTGRDRTCSEILKKE